MMVFSVYAICFVIAFCSALFVLSVLVGVWMADWFYSNWCLLIWVITVPLAVTVDYFILCKAAAALGFQ